MIYFKIIFILFILYILYKIFTAEYFKPINTHVVEDWWNSLSEHQKIGFIEETFGYNVIEDNKVNYKQILFMYKRWVLD